jgi:hypothetical protein
LKHYKINSKIYKDKMATFEAYVQGTEQSQSQKEKDKRTMTTEQQNVALKQKHASLLTHVQHLDQKIKGFITDDLHLTRKQHESLQDLSSHATATVEEAAAPDEVFLPPTSDATASGTAAPGTIAQLREGLHYNTQLRREQEEMESQAQLRLEPVLITKEDVNKFTKQA